MRVKSAPLRNRARAGERILTYHVSAWLPNTTDLRFDRGMPGDGVIDLLHLREVEILLSRWCSLDPDDVVNTVKQRFRSAM